MKVRLNGTERELQAPTTVRGLLEQIGLADATCAVAINRAFVPRSEHDARRLAPDDEVEIVAPMQGG